MTKEEFKQYSELQEKFAKDVWRVISFLKEIDADLNFVSEFQLIDGSVKTHGWEYGTYQYQEEHYSFFDSEMLTWSDDELREYVEQIKKGKEEERVREEIEIARKKEEEERREYERLKEKYEKQCQETK